MPNIKHVVLHQDWLTGWHYGTLKALQDEIVKQTNADVITVPKNEFEKRNGRLEHGRRLDFLRKYLPKMELPVLDADVAWYILMAPADHKLDLYKKWYSNVKYRIVYVFDTLATLEKSLISAFSDDTFNIHITSFHDAVPWLEKITGKKWYAIEQAAPEGFFDCLPFEERVIPFASYGRKLDSFHKILMEFIKENKLYYDFTTCNGTLSDTFDPYSYNHYGWHVSHSMFNVCWPVEITSPVRAGFLKPITCRWFEVAAAGTPIIGKKPDNVFFDKVLDPSIVIDIDPFSDRKVILDRLELIWRDKEKYIKNAIELQKQNVGRWTWKNRVERMLNLIS